MVKGWTKITLRPLPTAHWSLPATIVGFAVLLTFAHACREWELYPELSWVLLTSTLVLWTNHLAEAPVLALKQVSSILLRSLVDGLLLVLWIILTAIPLAIVSPTYQCYNSRAKVSEIVLAASTLRSQVEGNALAKGSLDGSGQGLVFSPLGRAVAGFVTRGGEIIAIGDDPPVVIVLSPKFAEASITWTCNGYPRKIVPKSCRGEE